MTPEARQHLRKVARERDANQAQARFRLAQAEVDMTDAKQRRAAAEKAKEKAEKQQASLEAFNPILDLGELLEDGACDKDTAKRIQKQVVWHRRIGGDVDIPPYVSRMKKNEAWDVMVNAVRRHLSRTPAENGDSFQYYMSSVALIDGLVNPNEETSTPRSTTGITLVVSADATDADTDMNIDSDPMEESQFDCTLLDDYSEGEGEVDDSEDGDQNDKAVEATMVGVPVDEMDVDEEVATTRPHYGVCETLLPFRAGCVWTRPDWSCAYDAVFMAFFAIYWQSSPAWRDDWRRQSRDWTAPLTDHFNTLLEALGSQRHTPKSLSTLFSYLRDKFRDKLSSFDPQRFPRRGQLPASVCAILELLFGSELGPGIDQDLSCPRCGVVSQISHHFPLLAFPAVSQHLRLAADPRFVPSETLLARFINVCATQSPPLCGACHVACEVSLTMANPPWIWFEINGNNTMSPSPTVPINLPNQRLTYNLHSVIYIGENHFTARIRDPSNGWWNYDGMWRFGAPQRDYIQNPHELLRNGSRRAAFFIYRHSDC